MINSSSVVRITDLFGSNSPGRPERDRRSTSSPRTSVLPKLNCQSALTSLRRVQRQPLTVLSDHRSVKTSTRIHDVFLSRRPDLKTQREHSAHSVEISPLSSPPTTSSGRSNSRRVLIVPSSGADRKPLRTNNITSRAGTKPYSTLPTEPDHHPTKKPGTRAYRAEPVQQTPSFPAPPHQPPSNGPCRNRTYNLAIKSRLLCQLS